MRDSTMHSLNRRPSSDGRGLPTTVQTVAVQSGFMAHARKCVILLEMEAGVRRDSAVTALQSGGATVIATVTRQPLDNLDAVFASNAVVLDGAATSYDSLDICRRLAELKGPPVILMTASDNEAERIAGLESGADDCLPSSASARELMARVFALVRRTGLRAPIAAMTDADARSRISFAGWSFCPRSGQLKGPTGRTGFLPRTDHAILAALVEHPREILSMDRLAELIDGEPLTKVAKADWRVRISRLRRRLDRLDGGGRLIQTVHGKGYVFAADCMRDLT